METKIENLYSDKLAWGITLLALASLTDTILAGYSLANLGLQVNAEMINNAAAGANALQVIIGCLSPLGFLLKIVAIFLIFQDSKRLSALTEKPHRKWVLAGTICFVLGLLATIGSTVLSFNGVMGGSIQSLQLSMGSGLAASLLGFTVTFLLVYHAVPQFARLVMAAALVVYIAVTSYINVLTMQFTELQSYEMMGNTFFVPSMTLDRTQGIYPFLEGASALAIILTFLVLLTTSIQAWRSLTRELPESVA